MEDGIITNKTNKSNKEMRTNNKNNIKLIEGKNFDELLRVNYLYILKIANSYKQDNSLLKDLVQEGRIGLVEAAHIYDKSINPNFLNIATYYIKKYMTQYLRNNISTIKLPNHYWSTKKYIEKKMDNDELYDIYSDDELTKVEKLVHTNAKRIISGDLSNDDGKTVVFNSIAYNDGDYEQRTQEEYQARHRVFNLLEKLKVDDQKLIRMYFGIDTEQKNIVEIAELLNCTKQNISLKLKRILKKLSTF